MKCLLHHATTLCAIASARSVSGYSQYGVLSTTAMPSRLFDGPTITTTKETRASLMICSKMSGRMAPTTHGRPCAGRVSYGLGHCGINPALISRSYTRRASSCRTNSIENSGHPKSRRNQILYITAPPPQNPHIPPPHTPRRFDTASHSRHAAPNTALSPTGPRLADFSRHEWPARHGVHYIPLHSCSPPVR